MPFIRYTRDKRGYETTYVMHAYRTAQGNGRTRVLYLFRSPALQRIGRQPLDDEARDGLEHTHPDLSFDWQALGREATSSMEAVREQRSVRPGPNRHGGSSDRAHRSGGGAPQAGASERPAQPSCAASTGSRFGPTSCGSNGITGHGGAYKRQVQSVDLPLAYKFCRFCFARNTRPPGRSRRTRPRHPRNPAAPGHITTWPPAALRF